MTATKHSSLNLSSALSHITVEIKSNILETRSVMQTLFFYLNSSVADSPRRF
jgi:hypothetical protein